MTAGINILPKGHIEIGENPEAAAIRELREEAGVIADVIAPLGTMVHGSWPFCPHS